PVAYSLSQSLKGENTAKLLGQFPESKRIFLGAQYGDKLIQPELAETLKRIRDQEATDFCEGETAKRLTAAMQANGGLITLDDLKNHQAEERAPLRRHYRVYEVNTSAAAQPVAMGS